MHPINLTSSKTNLQEDAQNDSQVQEANLPENYLNTISADIIRKILSPLSFEEGQRNRQVCKRWKQIIDDSEFLKLNAPVFSTLNFPTTINLENLMQIVKRYGTKTLNQVKLDYLSKIGDHFLTSFSDLKTQTLSIKGFCPKVSSSGLQAFLQKRFFIEPATICINKNFLEDKERSDTFLQGLIDQRITLNKLELKDCNNISAETFIEFVQKGGLTSPCHLSLTGCYKWVNTNVLKALENSNAQFNYLDLSWCDKLISEDISSFIQAGKLCSISHLLLERINFNNQILQDLTDKKIQLATLVLDSGDLSNEALVNFIKNQGLISPCQLNLYRSYSFTPEIVEALINQEIKLKVGFSSTETDVETFKALLNANCIQKIEKCWFTYNSWLLSVVDLLIEKKVIFKNLCFEDDENRDENKEAFLKLLDSDCFNPTEPCKLDFYRQPWLNNEILKTLAEKSIKLKHLRFFEVGPFLDEGLVRVCERNLFNKNSKFDSYGRLENLDNILNAFAKTSVKDLNLRQVETNYSLENLKNLLINPNNFLNLQGLSIDSYSSLENQDEMNNFKEYLKEIRPYIKFNL